MSDDICGLVLAALSGERMPHPLPVAPPSPRDLCPTLPGCIIKAVVR